MDNSAGRTSSLREGGNVVSEGGVVDLVNEDTEESGGLVVRVGLELRIDLDDECGGDGREQTSLRLLSARANKNLVQLPTKIRVVFKSSSYFFMNSLSYSSDSLW